MDAIFKINSSEFNQAAEELLNNLYNIRKSSITVIDQSVLDEAKDELRKLIYNCNFNINKIEELLHEKNLDQEKTKSFTYLLNSKQNTLLFAALNYYNSSNGDIVSETDWQIKLVFGTSELKTLKYSLLQLTFNTVDNRGEQKNNTLDLKKDTALKMIQALETMCNTNT